MHNTEINSCINNIWPLELPLGSSVAEDGHSAPNSAVKLMFMGPCNVSIFQYISNRMQRYTVYLYLEAALHVSGGTSTHHQERIQLYLQHLVFVRPLLQPAAAAGGRSQ